MPAKRFSKEHISIEKIGLFRFWIGVVAGLFSALAIALAFNYSREVLRAVSGMQSDLLILEEHEVLFFNYFFSILSAVLGLSIAIWIWMNTHVHKRRKDRIYKQFARTHLLLIFWVILMGIARFGSILPIILYGLDGYESHLNLADDYWILFVLMPLVVFLQGWSTVRLVYHSGKWILLSLLCCILVACALNATATIDHEIINKAYHHKYEEDYRYIDEEISKAETAYGIKFDAETIDNLKKWHTKKSSDQVMCIKAAFESITPVSLDTIILQRIVIRNLKESDWQHDWQYSEPEHILKQIHLFDANSHETQELFKVIKEAIDLVNASELEYDNYKNLTETELRRVHAVSFHLSTKLRRILRALRNILLEDERYFEMAKQLPEVIIKPSYAE
jgi:hypothetical protein